VLPIPSNLTALDAKRIGYRGECSILDAGPSKPHPLRVTEQGIRSHLLSSMLVLANATRQLRLEVSRSRLDDSLISELKTGSVKESSPYNKTTGSGALSLESKNATAKHRGCSFQVPCFVGLRRDTPSRSSCSLTRESPSALDHTFCHGTVIRLTPVDSSRPDTVEANVRLHFGYFEKVIRLNNVRAA
jgi:hypothetical protein